MIKYLFLQTVLTIIMFMVWIRTTNLPGGEIGMTPFLLGIFLLIQFGIGVMLSLMFRRYLTTVDSLLIGMIIYLVIYELGPIVIGSKPMILGVLEDGADGEINRVFALIPLISGVIALITIVIRE